MQGKMIVDAYGREGESRHDSVWERTTLSCTGNVESVMAGNQCQPSSQNALTYFTLLQL